MSARDSREKQFCNSPISSKFEKNARSELRADYCRALSQFLFREWDPVSVFSLGPQIISLCHCNCKYIHGTFQVCPWLILHEVARNRYFKYARHTKLEFYSVFGWSFQSQNEDGIDFSRGGGGVPPL